MAATDVTRREGWAMILGVGLVYGAGAVAIACVGVYFWPGG